MTAPNAIANLSLWLKGDAGGPYQDSGTSTPCLSAGDLVQHWADQSGNNNDASQSTSGSRPTYQPNTADTINGIPVVRWPNKNNAYSMNIANWAPSGGALTMFFLTRGGVEATSLAGPFGFSGSLNVELNNGKPALFFGTGGAVNGTLYTPMRPMVWGFVSNGSQVTIYLDRATYTLTGTFGGSLTSAVLGNNPAGNVKIDFAELVGYSRALTATEISGLLTYFEGRGNIAAASTKTKLLAFDGDSLTTGGDDSQETTTIPNNYPNQLLTIINDPATEGYNFGNSGSVSSTLLSNRPTVVDPLLNPLQYLSSTLVLWIGSNDVTNGVSAATTWANIQSYISGAKTAGWGRVGVLTVLPASSWNSTQQTTWNTLNASIRAGYAAAGADFLVDVQGNANLGPFAQSSNLLWYTVDGTHLTTAGYNLVAQLVSSPVLGPSSVASLLWSAYPAFQQNVKVWKGADQLLSFAPSGTQPAITGWNLAFSVRQNYGTGSILIQKTGNAIQITNAVGGLFTVTLNSADTSGLAAGNYVYDVWRTDAGAGDPLAVGSFVIMPEVRL